MPLKNNKQPVTYGKSYSRKFNAYLGSKQPETLSSSGDKWALGHSDSPNQELQAPMSSFHSLATSSLGDNHNAPKRRRRNFDDEERRGRDFGGSGSHNISSTRPSAKSRGDSCPNVGAKNIPIEPREDENLGLRDGVNHLTTVLPNRQFSSSSEASPRTDLEYSGGDGPSHSSRHPRRRVETDSTRKRLIDSLGTTTEGVGTLGLTLADEPHCHAVSNHRMASEDYTQPRRLARDLSSSKAGNAEHVQSETTAQLSAKSRSTRVTYSRQRSFLDDVATFPGVEHKNITDSSVYDGATEPPNIMTTTTLSANIEDDESNRGRPVRSIHELRQAGDNARFRETLDSNFEDIEDIYNSTSDRCCSFAQLCLKLLEPQFVRRFSEHGFDERLAGCTTSSLDVVSISLALSCYILIQASGASSHILSGSLWGKILGLSPTLLDIDDDLLLVAKTPSLGLSKTAQASVRSVRSHISSAIKFPSPKISPCLLALECLRSSLSKFRENGETIESIPEVLLAQLVELLMPKSSETLKFPLSTEYSRVMESVFSILENYTIISGPLDDGHRHCFQRLSRLHRLLGWNSNDQNERILNLYIRVILNLTNKEPLLCNNFATDELVSGLIQIFTTKSQQINQDSPTKESSALDTVILALGALINLTEKTELSRFAFLRPDGESLSFLHHLLEQFAGGISFIDQAHSVPEVHHNVVTGYLSILLLTLCLNAEAYLVIKSSSNGRGLPMVISTAEKFIQYHQTIEREFEAGNEKGSGLTSRLEHILSQIRHRENFAL